MDQLRELYASIDGQQQRAHWQQQHVAQQQAPNSRSPNQLQRQSLDDHAPQGYKDPVGQQVLLDQGSWRQQSLPQLHSFAGVGSSTQVCLRAKLSDSQAWAACLQAGTPVLLC